MVHDLHDGLHPRTPKFGYIIWQTISTGQGQQSCQKWKKSKKLFKSYRVNKNLRPVAAPAAAYESVQKHKVTPGIPGWLNKPKSDISEHCNTMFGNQLGKKTVISPNHHMLGVLHINTTQLLYCWIMYGLGAQGKCYFRLYPRDHDVIKWKHFLRYWPFVRGIERSPVNSPHKGQWRGALILTVE